MKLNEDVKATGQLQIKLFGKDGHLKEERTVPNLVVTTGRNWIAGRVTGSPTAMSHMAIGTNTTAPALGDTTLGTEVARVALTAQNTANNVSTFSATFGAGVGTGSITEAGIFNANAAGTMLNRATFGVITKGADDTMQINWTVTQQ